MEKNSTAVSRLDAVDIALLRELQKNCRLTVKELSAAVNLSPTPVFERLKRLEQSGYILRYVAVLDADMLNCGLIVFCNVKMRRINRDIAEQFVNRIAEIPEVTECYNISGAFDFMLKIHAPDMKYYQEFVLNVLGTIDFVASIESTFVMAKVKDCCGLPLPSPDMCHR